MESKDQMRGVGSRGANTQRWVHFIGNVTFRKETFPTTFLQLNIKLQKIIHHLFTIQTKTFGDF